MALELPGSSEQAGARGHSVIPEDCFENSRLVEWIKEDVGNWVETYIWSNQEKAISIFKK